MMEKILGESCCCAQTLNNYVSADQHGMFQKEEWVKKALLFVVAFYVSFVGFKIDFFFFSFLL